MKKLELDPTDINLDITLLGGQCFNWIKIDNEAFYGVFCDRVIKILKKDNKLYWSDNLGYDKNFIYSLFDINTDYTKIKIKLKKFFELDKIIEKLGTIRILNQSFDQTFISFLISQNNNIKRIKKILLNISKIVHKETFFDNEKFFLFPELKDIINLPEDLIKSTGVGYRANFILDLKNNTKKLESLEINRDINFQKETLKSIKGVGDKVADCTLVFSLGHRNITPIDRWMKKYYFNQTKTKNTYKGISRFFTQKFGNLTAYAGQYIFEYQRIYKNNR